MKKTSKPKKKAKKVVVRKKRKKVRPAKRELLKAGTYARFVDVSDRTDMAKDLQHAFVGAMCPVISPEEPSVRGYVEEVKESFLDANGERGEYIGYLVEKEELILYLLSKDLQDTVSYLAEVYQREVLWFPPECCVEVKKNQLN